LALDFALYNLQAIAVIKLNAQRSKWLTTKDAESPIK